MSLFGSKSIEEKIRKILKRVGFHKIIIWEGILPSVINPAAKTILDLGCGKGDPMSWISAQRQLRFRVGMDLERVFLFESLKQGNHDAHLVGDIEFIPIRSKSVDVCLLLGVLSYLEKKKV